MRWAALVTSMASGCGQWGCSMNCRGVTGALIGLAVSAVFVTAGTHSALAPVTIQGADAPSHGSEANLRLDADGSSGFSRPILKPADSRSRCQTITYRGTSSAALRLYARDVHTTRGMGSQLLLRVYTGSGPIATGCRGFRPLHLLFSGPLAAFPTSWNAATSLPLANGGLAQVRYRITYQLSATAPNSAQGGTAGLRLVWEVRASTS